MPRDDTTTTHTHASCQRAIRVHATLRVHMRHAILLAICLLCVCEAMPGPERFIIIYKGDKPGGRSVHYASVTEPECCSYVYKNSKLDTAPQTVKVYNSTPSFDNTIDEVLNEINSKLHPMWFNGRFSAFDNETYGGIVYDQINTIQFGSIDFYPSALAVTALWIVCSDPLQSLVTCPTNDTATIRIVEWDQIYNIQRYTFSTESDVEPTAYSLRYVMLHEMLHVLGLGDITTPPECSDNIMWYRGSPGNVASHLTSLESPVLNCLTDHGYSLKLRKNAVGSFASRLIYFLF